MELKSKLDLSLGSSVILGNIPVKPPPFEDYQKNLVINKPDFIKVTVNKDSTWIVLLAFLKGEVREEFFKQFQEVSLTRQKLGRKLGRVCEKSLRWVGRARCGP